MSSCACWAGAFTSALCKTSFIPIRSAFPPHCSCGYHRCGHQANTAVFTSITVLRLFEAGFYAHTSELWMHRCRPGYIWRISKINSIDPARCVLWSPPMPNCALRRALLVSNVMGGWSYGASQPARAVEAVFPHSDELLVPCRHNNNCM